MRALNSVERAWHMIGQHGSANAMRSFCIQGPLTVDMVQQAFGGLLAVYPILRCRIVHEGARLLFREHDTLPRVRVLPSDGTPPSRAQLAQIAEELLNHPICPAAEALVQFLFMPGGDGQHWIFLNFHHAISDGATNVAVIACFLRLCDALLESQQAFEQITAAESARGNLSPSLTESFGKTGLAHRSAAMLRFVARRMMQEARYRAWKPGPSLVDALPRCRVLERLVASADVDAVRLRAKETGLTLNAVFTASILLAIKQVLFPLRRRANVSCVTFVNLRNRCNPRIPAEAVGCYISAAFSFHTLERSKNLMLVASDLQRQLGAAAKEDVFMQANAADWMTRTLFALGKTTAATLSVSNIGQVAPQVSSRSFRVREIHVHSALSGVGSTLSVGLTSTQECLSFDLTYIEGVLSADLVMQIANQTLEHISAFAKTPVSLGQEEFLGSEASATLAYPRDKRSAPKTRNNVARDISQGEHGA